jgi:hypothetical protein
VRTVSRDTDTPTPLGSLRDRLTDYDGVDATIHDDDTAMTPMLSVAVEGGRTRAAVLREAYAFEREASVRVTAVHRHRIVVRAD